MGNCGQAGESRGCCPAPETEEARPPASTSDGSSLRKDGASQACGAPSAEGLSARAPQSSPATPEPHTDEGKRRKLKEDRTRRRQERREPRTPTVASLERAPEALPGAVTSTQRCVATAQ
eukprot:TRINITY_DN13554_c0_g1_i3.p1 TRINITY_DN13554_c0_g1~~TRINITY_DN13554_c0_g1_i3.p1  ORF type:complete len:120 (+),score=2.05 TRINITY_DN13554_c0_g1_i3:12-371(+)